MEGLFQQASGRRVSGSWEGQAPEELQQRGAQSGSSLTASCAAARSHPGSPAGRPNRHATREGGPAHRRAGGCVLCVA